MDHRTAERGNFADWSPDEYYLAIWTYDRLDEDPSLYKEGLFQKVGRMTGRSPKSIASLVRRVAFCDPRPADRKPVEAVPDDLHELESMFQDYWQNRLTARRRYAEIRDRVQAQAPDETVDEETEDLVEPSTEDPWEAWRVRWTLPLSSPLQTQEAALKRTRERVGSFRAFPTFLRQTWSAHPFRSEYLDGFAATVRDLDRRTSGMTLPPPPDPEAHTKAKARWEGNGKLAASLENREIRMLCQHPATALSASWIWSIGRLSRFRRSWIEHLLGHYLAQWRSMPEAEELEVALKVLLARVTKTERWGVELADANRDLIGAEAPRRLLQGLPNPLYGWEGVTSQWTLSRETGLGRAVMMEALDSWHRLWRSQRPKVTIQETTAELRDAFDGLLAEPGIPVGVFTVTVSSLILSEWAKNHPEVRDVLLDKVLRHPRLGDPRAQPQNWYPMAEARDRVISWMARKDLRFFYDSVVSDHSDDQGRKAFWLRYVDQVSDFRLVLCEEDQRRMESILKETPLHFARMEGTNKPSAFILKFRSKRGDDLICVEFSKTGNSLYTYDAVSFEAGVGSLDALNFRIGSEPRNLKSTEYSMYQKRHIGNWQHEVAIFLKGYGIGLL